jgi:glycosyltransferase involved in cell wall biosynthesis
MDQQNASAKNGQLVSVIVPTYNRAGLMVEAIQSGLNQTYGNVEVIVVDDGSTDETLRVLNELSQKYPEERFRYLSQQNKGPSASRNAGLDVARGAYVKFLDSDDTLELDAIEHYIRSLESTGADLCIGSRRFMSPEGRKWKVEYSPPAGLVENPLEKFFDLVLRPPQGFWCFKMKIFNEGLRWDTELAAREDTDLLGNVLADGRIVAGAPQAIYNHRYHSGPRQGSRQSEKAVFRSIYESNRRLYEKLVKNGRINQCARSFARSMSRTALRGWAADREGAKLCYALARMAYSRPELVLAPTYPLGKKMRVMASMLWSIGGVRLCGPLFGLYLKMR